MSSSSHFEACLRDLQSLLKELRELQIAASAQSNQSTDGNEDRASRSGGKRIRSGPRQFLSLQRKLFQKLSQLRAILFDECYADSPNAFTAKGGLLAKLQGPCEKLLRGMIERLGSAASCGGFTLTPTVYATIGDCLEIIYRYGSQRTLLESMAKWEQFLLDKATTQPSRIAMFHCAEVLFVSQGRRLGSYLGSFVACASKQFKMVRSVNGNDICAATVRAAGVRCVGRAVHATGNSGLSEHANILKLVKQASQDKSSEVRQSAAGALLALGQSASEWADFSPDRSVTVEALLAVGVKAMDDGNEANQEVQLAFGRAVGHILSFSVEQTLDEQRAAALASQAGAGGTSGNDLSMGGGDGAADGKGSEGGAGGGNGRGIASQGGEVVKSGDSSKSRGRGKSGGFRLKFGSSKKETLRFTMSSAISYLRNIFTKSSNIRKGSMGSVHALVALLRSVVATELSNTSAAQVSASSRGDGMKVASGSANEQSSSSHRDIDNSNFWGETIDELLTLAKLPSSGAELPAERLRALSMVFEHGLLDHSRSEAMLQQILTAVLVRLLRNANKLARDRPRRRSNSGGSGGKKSSRQADAESPDGHPQYNGTQVTFLLLVAGKATAALGDAALGIASSRDIDFVNILFDYSSTPSRMVRTEVASVCRTLMSTLPSLGAYLLNKFVASMIKDHSELTRLASTTRRKSPSDKERRMAMRIIIGLKGRSVSVAALLYALPACPLGLPRSTSTEVLYLATAFLHHHSDEMLVPSAANACATAGWIMIGGLIAGVGVSALQPHFASLFQVFEEVFPAGSRPRSLGVCFDEASQGGSTIKAGAGAKKSKKIVKNCPLHELEATSAAATALLHLMRSWPAMYAERPDFMVRASKCIINLVSSLDSPEASLKAFTDANGSKTDSTILTGSSTTVTSHVLFLTIHAACFEMCALLPLDRKFLVELSPSFAASFPALLASSVRLFVGGNFGETSLLSTHCLLDPEDSVLQMGSSAWQSSSHLGMSGAHSASFCSASADKEMFVAAVAATWGGGTRGKGKSSGGSSAKESPCYGILTETESEIALMEAMMWAAPLISAASGKGQHERSSSARGAVSQNGSSQVSVTQTELSERRYSTNQNSWAEGNTAEFPRRNGNTASQMAEGLIHPWMIQPAPAVSERLVDAAVSLFGRMFPHQNTHQRHHLLEKLVLALRESHKLQLNSHSVGFSTQSLRSNRNVVAALLNAVNHLKAGDMELVAVGPGERSVDITLVDASTSSSAENLKTPWLNVLRSILKSAMSSSDALIQRASAQAMGTLTAIVGGKFSRKTTAYLLQIIKQPGKKSAKHKDGTISSGLVAAASLSLATHFRVAWREEHFADGKGRLMGDVGAASSNFNRPRAQNIQDLDATIGSLAKRNIKEPVRSWALHAWWLMLRGSTMSPNAAKATLGLIESQLLAPTVGMPGGMEKDGSDSGFDENSIDNLMVQEKDATAVAKNLDTKLLLTLGRLLNIVVSGLGSRLESWLESTDSSITKVTAYSCKHKYINLMWAVWVELRRCPDENVVIECLRFVNSLSSHVPTLLFRDRRFATIVLPWVEGLLSGSDGFDLDASSQFPSKMGASLLASITGINRSAFSRLGPGDAGMRHSRAVQHAAIDCLECVAKRNTQIALLAARRLFIVMNREQGSIEASSTSVSPALPFGSKSKPTTEAISGDFWGESRSSPERSQILSVAECVPTSIPPFVGVQGIGLCDHHTGYGSALVMANHRGKVSSHYGNYGLPLAQHCRNVLLNLVELDPGVSSLWAYAWLVTCEDVIMARNETSDAAVSASAAAGSLNSGSDSDSDASNTGDDVEDREKSGKLTTRDSKGEGSKGIISRLSAVSIDPSSSSQPVSASVQSETLSEWPISSSLAPRWQTKLVAAECLQRLIKLAQTGKHKKRHFETFYLPGNRDDSFSEDNGDGYLVKNIRKLVQLACLVTTATSSGGSAGGASTSAPLSRLQTLGMTLVSDIIAAFAGTKEHGINNEDREAEGNALLLLYEAQLSSAMRSAFQQYSAVDNVSNRSSAHINIPLALHACAPLAAMVACSISQDPVIAKRTVKTLIMGDSKADKRKKKLKVKQKESGKHESNDNSTGIDDRYGPSLVHLPPAPPKSLSYQEYVGTCKLVARLNALAELQLATVPPQAYDWAWDMSNVLHATNEMAFALKKYLQPHIPVLREYWLALLRDQVSLRARARAVHLRRGNMSADTLSVIPAPLYSLLEHNEDCGQVSLVFRSLWPQVAQALASLMIMDNLWDMAPAKNIDSDAKAGEIGQLESAGSSPSKRRLSGLVRLDADIVGRQRKGYDVVLGICLRYLADSRICTNGMRVALAQASMKLSGNQTIKASASMPTGMRCLHAIRWCLKRQRSSEISTRTPENSEDEPASDGMIGKSASVGENSSKHIANDLLMALMGGLGNPDLGSNNSILQGMRIRQRSRYHGSDEKDRLGARLSALKLVKDLLVNPYHKHGNLNETEKNMNPFAAAIVQSSDDDYAVIHKLFEWITRSIYRDLPYLSNPVSNGMGDPADSKAGSFMQLEAQNSSSSIENTLFFRPMAENLHLACEAFDVMAVVFQVAHSSAAIEYLPNALALLIRGLRLVSNSEFWSSIDVNDTHMRWHFVSALQNLSSSLAEIKSEKDGWKVFALETRQLFCSILVDNSLKKNNESCIAALDIVWKILMKDHVSDFIFVMKTIVQQEQTQNSKENLLSVLRMTNCLITDEKSWLSGLKIVNAFSTTVTRKLSKRREKDAKLSVAQRLRLVAAIVPLAIEASTRPQTSFRILLESAKLLMESIFSHIEDSDEAADILSEPLNLVLQVLCRRNQALDINVRTEVEDELRLMREVRCKVLLLLESHGDVFRMALKDMPKASQNILQHAMQCAISERNGESNEDGVSGNMTSSRNNSDQLQKKKKKKKKKRKKLKL